MRFKSWISKHMNLSTKTLTDQIVYRYIAEGRADVDRGAAAERVRATNNIQPPELNMAEPRDDCHHLIVNGTKPRHEPCLVKRID